jgi:hypothetical protein
VLQLGPLKACADQGGIVVRRVQVLHRACMPASRPANQRRINAGCSLSSADSPLAPWPRLAMSASVVVVRGLERRSPPASSHSPKELSRTSTPVRGGHKWPTAFVTRCAPVGWLREDWKRRGLGGLMTPLWAAGRLADRPPKGGPQRPQPPPKGSNQRGMERLSGNRDDATHEHQPPHRRPRTRLGLAGPA